MYLYAASSEALLRERVVKLGSTADPPTRLSTLLTGCPPGRSPSHDLAFLALWRTRASTRDELYDHEEELHERFARFRLMRAIPGDSEWFEFPPGRDALKVLRAFMASRNWVECEVARDEVVRAPRPSRHLRTAWGANWLFTRDAGERLRRLADAQAPVIDSIFEFLSDGARVAGHVIAPCGSGKTLMTCTAIARSVREGVMKRVVVCCPSRQIQAQWRETLVRGVGAFGGDDVLLLGQAGTTCSRKISDFCQRERFCVLSTYASSHLLLPHARDVHLLVLDEAHHMSGPVAPSDAERGEGRTRLLLARACQFGVKRLGLTFTPRYYVSRDAASNRLRVLSMDDADVFGPPIYELQLRGLIERGVLPDYRLWALRDETLSGADVPAKAECLAEAWRAREVVRGCERYVLHHMIVFCATVADAREMEVQLRSRVGEEEGTLVLRVSQGEDLSGPLAQFEAAKRAILVNCLVLNEGVDVPCANAVAITYPKQARGQIAQMVLRAGRWHPGKPLFHVLLPVARGEDLSGFEEVLCTLAMHDGRVRDEIVSRSTERRERAAGRKRYFCDVAEESDEFFDDAITSRCVMIDEYESREEEIRRCFATVRAALFSACEGRRVRALCVDKGVTTSVEYALLREELPELPEDPRPRGMTWFEFLNPGRRDLISREELVERVLLAQGLKRSIDYDQWRGLQPSDALARLPSVQNVADGCYGPQHTLFSEFLGGVSPRRRRELADEGG